MVGGFQVLMLVQERWQDKLEIEEHGERENQEENGQCREQCAGLGSKPNSERTIPEWRVRE